jgi:hypothetical protein
MRGGLVAAALAVACVAAGCDRGGAAKGAPRYQLACDSADTAESSTLFCVRTDTHNGDATIVDVGRLPITSGSSRAGDEQNGTYQTVCDSTVTPKKSDFTCLRLHTGTGDVVLLRLAELPHWPRP